MHPTKHYNYDNVKLEIVFYQNDYIFKYNTILKADPNLGSKANFTEQFVHPTKHYNYDNVKLEIVFYQNDYIFKYNTILKADPNLGSKANFTEHS